MAEPRLVEQRLNHVAELVRLLEAPRLDRLLAARQLGDRWSAQPDAVRATLRTWLSWWRDVLLVQLELQARVPRGGSEAAAAVRRVAAEVSPAEARATLGRLQQTTLDSFVETRPRMAADLGAGRMAEVMAEFSIAERQVNRAWSAACDGHEEEARSCLDNAVKLIQTPLEMLRRS